ncbi:hypothetical protein H257_07326 [Aphanomyces astaci]|uniref:BED-type domain-containing protein n=1 Tax=Aphanomyces astaci TaxID=112090 RepID=W4GHS3_APHAT|nr:hypothetical protein H257_07326 [Aphanomyces astaci]ETV79265.1 hypothetical protein H257_07326 [Aphanomyces astaci]|eukprot:XP_009831106.1 hypothetical protein H257_07326 [Aphanomyces astaci]
MLPPTTSATYAKFFFSLLEDTGRFECRLCTKHVAQQQGKGFTNLMSRLMTRHPDYPTVHSDALRASTPAIPVATFVSDTSKALFGWMDLVVTNHLPFSTVEDETFRKYFGLQATTAPTLRSTMNDVCFAVEAKIQQQLPELFGIELYSKKLDAITFVIGDNCSVNQRIAGLLNVPLIGCVSHHFNLAVQRMMEEHKNLSDRIHCVMLRARNVKNRSALRLLTPLPPKLRNDTRWSSTYAMVARFFEIKDHLAAITDLRAIFPAPVEIDAMHSLRAFPSMSHHLSPRAAIVKHPDFETAVINVIDGAVGELTEVERSALSGFEIATVISPASQRPEASAGLAMDILRSKSAKLSDQVVMGENVIQGEGGVLALAATYDT